MNTTSSDGLFDNSVNISGYHYLLGISVGIVILLTAVIIASYFCKIGREPFNSQGLRQHTSSPTSHIPRIGAVGLDAGIIKNYPKFLYSEVLLCATCTNPISFTSARCCSICLADYDNNDTIRLLPYCGHFFHVECVDPWLLQRPTCPICRSSSPEHVCETGTIESSMV